MSGGAHLGGVRLSTLKLDGTIVTATVSTANADVTMGSVDSSVASNGDVGIVIYDRRQSGFYDLLVRTFNADGALTSTPITLDHTAIEGAATRHSDTAAAALA